MIKEESVDPVSKQINEKQRQRGKKDYTCGRRGEVIVGKD